MKKKITFLAVASCFFIGGIQKSVAQQADSSKHSLNGWSLNIGAGSTASFGDMKAGTFFPVTNQYLNERKLGLNIGASKQITSKIALQGSFIFGQLGGGKISTDPKTKEKDFKAAGSNETKVNLFDLTVDASYNLTNNFFPSATWTHKFAINAYLGLGLISYNGKRTYINGGAEYPKTATYNSSSSSVATSLIIPIGARFNYNLTKKFDIGLDFSMRNVLSDKLDGYDKPGSRYDSYSYSAFNVVYKLGNTEKEQIQWIEPEERMVAEGLVPDMTKYDEKLKEVDQKLEELNQKNAEVDKKLIELDRKNQELNNKIEQISKLSETVSKSKETNVTEFFAIEFENSSAVLKKGSLKELKLLAEVLSQNPKCDLKVDGHTDGAGSAALNFKLSQQRANAVKDYLVKTGVANAVRIKTEAYGEQKPVADNTTEEGKAKNRRVELTVRCDDK